MIDKVILASASPRRKELLSIIDDSFSVIPSDVEEIIPDDLDVYLVPQYLSQLKAQDIAKANPHALVIGADTAVIIGNDILGKPKTKSEAYSMIKKLSGKTHYVVTGCTLILDKKILSFSEKTAVTFYTLDETQIEEYINSDEPYDKAGGYGIQGKGSLLVEKIDGDYFNVVGLPIGKLNKAIKEISG